MSKFSNYLKYLIERNQQSISQLSRISGVERTTIHKALSDERILAYKSVEKLAQAFCLSPYEKSQFFSYHSMLLQGEDTYEARQIIRDIFKRLADIPVSALTHKKRTIWSQSLSAPSNEQFFHGALAVTDIIKYVLDQEVFYQDHPEIYLNFSLENTFLENHIFLLYQQEEKAVNISHIIPFPYRKNMESSAKYGLNLLKWILPLCLVANNNYHPYFYYDHSTVSYYSDPLPYYIITRELLLCLSEDLKTAILYTNPEIIQFYRQSALNTLTQCEALLTYSMNPFDILQQYMNASTSDGYYTIMSQPCVGKFYTRELIAAKIPQSLPFYQELVEMTDKRFQILRETTSNYYTIYTYQGIKGLAETGIICDLPRQYVDVFTEKERFSLIRSLRDDIANESIIGPMINPATFQIPEYLTFTIDPQRGTHIFTNLLFEEKAYYCNIHIIEPILSAAFYDFITNLPSSEYVYTKEDTLAMLDILLMEYEYGKIR